MHAPTATLAHVRAQARAITLKEAGRGVLAAYDRNDLLTYASAIAFQVLFALVPLALFALGLLGTLGLDEVWTRDVAPDIARNVSPAAFSVIDDTVGKVLGSRQLFWVTLGAVIAVWEISGATRAVMGVFDRIYGSERERDFKERYLTSLWLSVAAGGLLLLATAAFMLGPIALGTPAAILRWPIVALLLFTAVGLFVHFAPADRQPLDWVSFGSILVVVAWLGTSVGFAFYVRDIASYGSIFGALATVIIVFEYLYLAAIAFLTGAQVDALIRARVARAEEPEARGASEPPVAVGAR
jgi:membrane protein